MLSVEKITPAQGADYYKAENYYAKEEAKKQSQWSGQGATKLKLVGAVEGQAFKNLLDGYSPDRRQLLTGKANQKNHRAAYDLTFSAPKSVSLAALMGGQDQLIEAHRRAVAKTLAIIEQQYAQARIWDGEIQQRVNTGNLVIAQFHHTTSREKDPQVHTHCLLINCTQRDDGKWRSLANEDIYRHRILLGQIYRNELAQECRKLGYEIEKRPDELFEIKGYTRQQIEWFSKRRGHIIDLVGPDATAQQKQWAALFQRPPKGKALAPEELLGWWQAQDEALGLNLQHPTPQPPLVPEPHPVPGVNPHAAAAVSVAIEHCSERAVAFKHQAIEKFVLSEIQNFNYSELQAAIAQNPELIQTFDQRYTTQQALERELATIRLMQRGKGQMPAIAQPDTVQSYLQHELDQGRRLTQGQQAAVKLAATTPDQFSAWSGVAGAGKTYSLQLLKQIAETQGYSVKGFAPSGEAAKVLAKELEIEARTVASLLLSKQLDSLLNQQLWIVDEVGLLNAKDGYRLLQRAKDEGARVVLVGDTRQMSAVEAGSPFRSLLSAGIATAYLQESLRQKNLELKQAADLAAAGQHGQALNHLLSVGRVQSIQDQTERTRTIALEYLKLPPLQRSETLILAGTHKEKAQIMAWIRQGLKAEGSLSQDDTPLIKLKSKDLTSIQTLYSHNYEVGDVVVPVREYKRTGLHKSQPYVVEAIEADKLRLRDFSGNQQLVDPMKFRKTVYQQKRLDLAVGDRLKWTKTDKELGRTNGEEFVVTGLADRTASLQYEDGRTASLYLDQPLHLDYALVSTTYSSQGKTADHALISSTVDQTVSQESTYVAISRTRHDLKIFAEDTEFLMEQAQKSSAQENPIELLQQAEPKPKAKVAAPQAATDPPHQQVGSLPVKSHPQQAPKVSRLISHPVKAPSHERSDPQQTGHPLQSSAQTRTPASDRATGAAKSDVQLPSFSPPASTAEDYRNRDPARSIREFLAELSRDLETIGPKFEQSVEGLSGAITEHVERRQILGCLRGLEAAVTRLNSNLGHVEPSTDQLQRLADHVDRLRTAVRTADRSGSRQQQNTLNQQQSQLSVGAKDLASAMTAVIEEQQIEGLGTVLSTVTQHLEDRLLNPSKVETLEGAIEQLQQRFEASLTQPIIYELAEAIANDAEYSTFTSNVSPALEQLAQKLRSLESSRTFENVSQFDSPVSDVSQQLPESLEPATTQIQAPIALPPQVFLGSLPTPEKLNSARNYGPVYKPHGGLWTSSYDEKQGSEWLRFVQTEGHIASGDLQAKQLWLVQPKPDVKVLIVDSPEVLESLPHLPPPQPYDDVHPLDYEAIALDYDAMMVKSEAIHTGQEVYSFDIESTIWFGTRDWPFESVQALEMPTSQPFDLLTQQEKPHERTSSETRSTDQRESTPLFDRGLDSSTGTHRASGTEVGPVSARTDTSLEATARQLSEGFNSSLEQQEAERVAEAVGRLSQDLKHYQLSHRGADSLRQTVEHVHREVAAYAGQQESRDQLTTIAHFSEYSALEYNPELVDKLENLTEHVSQLNSGSVETRADQLSARIANLAEQIHQQQEQGVTQKPLVQALAASVGRYQDYAALEADPTLDQDIKTVVELLTELKLSTHQEKGQVLNSTIENYTQTLEGQLRYSHLQDFVDKLEHLHLEEAPTLIQGIQNLIEMSKQVVDRRPISQSNEVLQQPDIQQILDQHRVKYEVLSITGHHKQSSEDETNPFFRFGQEFYDDLVNRLQDPDLAIRTLEKSLDLFRTIDLNDQVANRNLYEELAAKVKRLPELKQADPDKIDQAVATFAQYRYGAESVPEIMAVSDVALNLKLDLPPKQADEQVEVYIQSLTNIKKIEQTELQSNKQNLEDRGLEI